MKRGQSVFYWYSASEIAGMKFLRWCVMRMCTGGKDTNKLGVGAIVSSTWRCDRVIQPKIDWGLKRGQKRLRPYWELFRTYRDAQLHRRKIRRPTVLEIRRRMRAPERKLLR